MNKNSAFSIAISIKADLPDPRGEGLQKDAQDLGIHSLRSARVSDIYIITGKLSAKEATRIGTELLADPVVQDYSIDDAATSSKRGVRVIEVAYNPGVMDPAEDSVRKGIRDLGISSVESVKTAKRYFLQGKVDDDDIATIADKLLVNPVIQHLVTEREKTSVTASSYKFKLETVVVTLIGRLPIEVR